MPGRKRIGNARAFFVSRNKNDRNLAEGNGEVRERKLL
jgi:hypothetical protein